MKKRLLIAFLAIVLVLGVALISDGVSKID